MASIQGIYVALFGRPADPAGLAWFNEVTNNGADLTAVGDLTGTAEYQSRFKGMTNEQIVNTVYRGLFERDAEPGGLDHFVEALNNGTLNINTIAINILDGAQGPDLLMVNAKIEAANLFTASLNTPEEIEAYVGDDAAAVARQWLDNVTPDNPGTPEDAQNAINDLPGYEPEPNPGQGGGGGNGGGNPPQPVATYDDEGNVWTIAGNADATVEPAGLFNLRITADGFRTVVINSMQDPVDEFHISAGATLTVEVSDVASVLALSGTPNRISGEGHLNIEGITLGDIKVGEEIGGFPSSPSQLRAAFINNVVFEPENVGHDRLADLMGHLLINGNAQDAFAAVWIALDAEYSAIRQLLGDTEGNRALFGHSYVDNRDPANPVPYGAYAGPLGERALEINSAFLGLGAAYADYLEAGGEPFVNFTVKFSPTRQQSLHDNILGNITEVNLDQRNFPEGVIEHEIGGTFADLFADRPIFSGNDGDPNNEFALAWDYANDIERPDYITSDIDAEVDAAAQDGDEMYYGDGNTVDGFSIVQHEGAGVELALKAKERGGPDYEGVLADDGVVEYFVDTGMDQGSANRVAWNFDFAVTTGLNGTDEDLADFRFVIRIDADASEDVDFIDYEFNGTAWVNADGDAFGGDDGGTAYTEQNSVNIGFGSILNNLEGYTLGGEGEFDIQLAAYDGATLIGVNSIRVIAAELVD